MTERTFVPGLFTAIKNKAYSEVAKDINLTYREAIVRVFDAAIHETRQDIRGKRRAGEIDIRSAWKYMSELANIYGHTQNHPELTLKRYDSRKFFEERVAE